MTTIRGPLVAALVAGAMTLAPRAEALQADVTPAELCSISDAVVIAQVVDLETLWAPGKDGGIERRAVLSVDKVLHGQAGSSLEVVLPGGEIDGVQHWVEDVPALRPDAVYMLFLDHSEAGWQVIGGDAGAVPLAMHGAKGRKPTDAIRTLEGCDAN